jgi:GxxExxY protein
MNIEALTEKIIGAAFQVHNHFGPGFLEKVYENALAIELAEGQGLAVRKQHPIPVFYHDINVGEYYADLVVENTILVEIKSVRHLLKEHEMQLVHYLTATGLDHGLLINFGPSVEVRHKYRIYRKDCVAKGQDLQD